MTGHDAIRFAFKTARNLTHLLTEDLSDADLLVRPVPGANHVAWQLGHLITSTHKMLGQHLGARAPALPAGFVDRHNEAASHSESNEGYLTKAAYLDLMDRMIEAATSTSAAMPDSALDGPNPGSLAKLAPTVGMLFQLAGEHILMHLGQFSTLRRALGKPHKF